MASIESVFGKDGLKGGASCASRPLARVRASLLAFACAALLLAFPLLPGMGAAHALETEAVLSLDSQSPAEQPVPDDIRRGLNIDERILTCFTDAEGNVRLESQWFAATRVDLNSDGHKDWIVHSTHSCPGEEGSVRWWVFRAFPDAQHQLVLATNAPWLKVLQEKAEGFSIIRTDRERYRYSEARTEYIAETDTRIAANDNGVDGVWRPESKSLEGPGPLTIAGESLQWSICKDATLDTPKPEDEGKGVVLDIKGSPGCQLDEHAVRHLRIKMREGGCKAELSLYASHEAMTSDEPLAWGVVSRARCNP